MSDSNLPRLFLVRDIPAWLAARGVVGPKGKPLLVGAIWQWIRDGRLKPVPGLPRKHVREEDLERLIRGAPEEEMQVRSSKLKGRSKQDRDWQKRQDEADVDLRRMGLI